MTLLFHFRHKRHRTCNDLITLSRQPTRFAFFGVWCVPSDMHKHWSDVPTWLLRKQSLALFSEDVVVVFCFRLVSINFCTTSKAHPSTVQTFSFGVQFQFISSIRWECLQWHLINQVHGFFSINLSVNLDKTWIQVYFLVLCLFFQRKDRVWNEPGGTPG